MDDGVGFKGEICITVADEPRGELICFNDDIYQCH